MSPDPVTPDTPLRLDYRKPAMTPLAYRPKDAAAMIGVRKTKFWEIVKAGRLPTRKLGTKTTVVMRDDLLTYLAEHPAVKRSLPQLLPQRQRRIDAAKPEPARTKTPSHERVARANKSQPEP